jgi:hypothetical protein
MKGKRMSEYRGKECALPAENQFWDREYFHSVVKSWENSSWLAYQLEKMDSRLNKYQWDILISAIESNHPVVIQYRTGEIDGNMYVTTGTKMVEYLAVNELSNNANRIRVSYWGGFNHDIYLSDIISITTPDSFLDREDEVVIRKNHHEK